MNWTITNYETIIWIDTVYFSISGALKLGYKLNYLSEDIKKKNKHDCVWNVCT